MTTSLYESGVSAFMDGDIDLINNSVYALLVTSAYTPSFSSDQFKSDIPDSATITDSILANKSVAAGVFRCDDTVFTSPVADSVITAIVLFKRADYPSTSQLIAYIDNAAELPLTLDGSDLTITWDTGANGVFKL